MKFIRRLLGGLIAIGIVALVGVLLAIAPTVQTWIAQAELSRTGPVHGTVGSVSAGFGEVDIEDLHLQLPSCAITLPSLKAKMPVAAALLGRRAHLISLVAKGWTIDCSKSNGAPASGAMGRAPETGGAESPRRVSAEALQGILAGLSLPCDVTLDEADLDGDVLLPSKPGLGPARLHLTVTGGGLSAAHPGAFSVDATCTLSDPGFPVDLIESTGQATVALDSGRRVSRVSLSSQVSTKVGTVSETLSVSATVDRSSPSSPEQYILEVAAAQRKVLGLAARLGGDARSLSGTWNADLRDSDLAPFLRGHPLPNLTAAGSGDFETDLAFERMNAKGSLRVQARQLQVLHPALPSSGLWNATADWEGRLEQHRLRIDRLNVRVGDSEPIAEVAALQPMEWNPVKGSVDVANPSGALLSIRILRLPETFLSGMLRPLVIAGGDVSGSFTLSRTDHGIGLRPVGPLTARGIELRNSRGPFASGLSLDALIVGNFDPEHWQLEWNPASIEASGRPLARLQGSIAGAWDNSSPATLRTAWNADSADVSGFLPGIPSARSVSGRLDVTWSDLVEIESQFTAAGLSGGHSISGAVSAQVTPHGSVHFQAPITLTLGRQATDLRAEGTWSNDKDGPNLAIRLRGASASFDDLRTLARPFAAYGLIPIEGQASLDGRDTRPFWGSLSASGGFVFDRLRIDGEELDDVAATFTVDHSKIHLVDGKVRLGQVTLAEASGTLVFDPLEKEPYLLALEGTFNDVDVGPFFASPHSGDPPWVEGRFSIGASARGSGTDLADLMRHTDEEFHLASTTGVIRLLRTNVADAIPETPTPVADAVGSVGSLVGSVFGVKGGGGAAGNNPLTKNEEAVVDFTNQVEEIGCDKIGLNASRTPDGAFRLSSIQIEAQDEQLTGSGTIAARPGVPLFQRPLSLDLNLVVRDEPEKLLSTVGLLAPEKGARGRALAGTIHLGGTLRDIDESAWHDLLAKAATRRPAAESAAQPPRATP